MRYATCSDGEVWTQPKVFAAPYTIAATRGPALATFTDSDHTQTLYAITVAAGYVSHWKFNPDNGGSWGSLISVLPSGSTLSPGTQPTLAQFQNQLICAFQDQASSQLFTVTWTSGQKQWNTPEGRGVYSTKSPAVVTRYPNLDPMPYLIFPDSRDRNTISSLVFKNGTWGPGNRFISPPTTPSSTSAAANPDTTYDLFLTYVQNNDLANNVLVSILSGRKANIWTNGETIAGQTKDTPQITTQGSMVYVAYNARNAPVGQLWWSSKPASSW